MSREITNSEDIIDSRDVIKRIEELESDLESEYEDWRSGEDNPDEEPEATKNLDRRATFEEWLAEVADPEDGDVNYEAQELLSLRKLAEEGESSPDWNYGETLIRDSYFRTYAEELAEDCGMIPRDLKWPCNHIDWDAACDELKQDYLEIDFDGETYWIRA